MLKMHVSMLLSCSTLLLVLAGYVIAFAGARAGPGGRFQNRAGGGGIETTRFIDLSHAFNNHTPVWPGRKITLFSEFGSRDENGIWVVSNGFCTSEHTSTHIDAPYHFNDMGRRLDEIPFEDLIDIPGVMIDIYDKVHQFTKGELIVVENYGLTREDVLDWEEKNGKIPQGAVVLLRTGWESRWGNEKLFRGEKEGTTIVTDKDSIEDNELESTGSGSRNKFYDPSVAASFAGKLSFPGFGETAAKFLAEEINVRGVGVDVISIDPGNRNKPSPAHVAFASRNIYMLEMVSSLHTLPPRGFNLWMLPFKIDRGTGAPTRVIARLNERQI